jgi:predicted transcriptional regulator of viral defense system
MKRLNLGPLETNFFAWVQMRKVSVVRTGDAAKALTISQRSEEQLLSRLLLSGMIARLTKGVYLVPQRLPLGGFWGPPQALVLSEIMKFYGGQYQLTGMGVFNHYGFTTQVANRTIAYNNKISGERKIGNLIYEFIEVPTKRLGGIEEVPIEPDLTINYPTLGRTLLDAVYDWSRFNTLPRAFEWIEKSKKNRDAMTDLVKWALKAGNVSTRRRLGYWLERIQANPTLVRRLAKSVEPTSAFIPLIPGRPALGKTNKQWGLVINE